MAAKTPGGTIIYKALRAVEQLVLDKNTRIFRDHLAVEFAQLVYDGRWFTRLREILMASADELAKDVNTMCEGDGEKTPGLAAYIGLCIITCGIYGLWWMYKIGNRLQANAPRYGLTFQENGTTVLMWQIFGCILCFIGPFIAMNILIKNTNALAGAYNNRLFNNA